jgi:hypothetical protein
VSTLVVSGASSIDSSLSDTTISSLTFFPIAIEKAGVVPIADN